MPWRENGLFFQWLNHIHARFRTPSRAILAHVAWASVILLVRGSFENIVAGMVFAILIFYTMTTLALFIFRRQRINEGNAFKMTGYPLLPIFYPDRRCRTACVSGRVRVGKIAYRCRLHRYRLTDFAILAPS